MTTNPPTRSRYELPRWFEDFPEDAVCPICDNNNHGATILVPIDGTAKDGIAAAVPVHLVCALPKNYHQAMQVLYRRKNP